MRMAGRFDVNGRADAYTTAAHRLKWTQRCRRFAFPVRNTVEDNLLQTERVVVHFRGWARDPP